MNECGTMRILTLTALAFGLTATGTLSLAVSTDFWLYTSEPLGDQTIFDPEHNITVVVKTVANIHSGLWRACLYYEDFGGKKLDPALEKLTGVKVVMSGNGWMKEDVTKVWLETVVGKLSFSQRLLVWDSFRCQISKATKEILDHIKVDQAVIPGGCTGLIQAPDVCWNAPFKAYMKARWEEWMTSGDKTFTKGGNMRAPTKMDICLWVKSVWDSLDKDLIVRSFQSCALTNDLKDLASVAEIHVCKEGQILHDRMEGLKEKCKELIESDGDLSDILAEDNTPTQADVDEDPLVVEDA